VANWTPPATMGADVGTGLGAEMDAEDNNTDDGHR